MSSTRIKGAQLLNLKEIIRGNLTVAGDELSEEGVDEGDGVELQQVGHLLAYAYVADGKVEFAGDGYGDSALCRAVELGEDDARNPCGLSE